MVLSFLRKKDTKKPAVKKTPARTDNQPALRSYKQSGQAQEEIRLATEALKDAPEITIAGLDISKTVLEGAAVHFADGNPNKAIEILVSRLNEHSGQVDLNEWYMIFDAYQSTGQQNRFEKLALFFSSLFGISPPAWEQFHNDTKNRDAMGRSALNIDGSISDLHSEKIKDFLSASKESKTCRIDFSRIKLLDNDPSLEESLARLLKMMQEIRKHKISGQIMGDMNFIDILKEHIAYIKDVKEYSDKNKAYWLILLELYQWHGQEAEFDELGYDYAMNFEESPPSYNESQVMKSLSDPEEENYLNDDGSILAEPIIDRQNISKLIKYIDEQIKQQENVVIDFKYTSRLDFYAAMELAKHLGNLGLDNSRIIIRHPIELIVTLLNMTGVSSFITYIPRKR
jgi:tetratricopeptide (TPR) repeat protein